MKKFLSIGVAAVLLIIFAIACAVATIVETIHGTPVAKAMIYNSTWFGVIMVLLAINLAFNIFKYNLINWKKFPALVFHVSFLFILAGAIITHYLGFEGSMHIRQGQTTNVVSTSEIFVQLATMDKSNKFLEANEKNFLKFNGKMDFDLSLKADEKQAVLKYKDYIQNGGLKFIESGDKNDKARIELMFSDEHNRKNLSLIDGESAESEDLSIAFNAEPKRENFIRINLKDDKFYINTNLDLNVTKMADMSQSILPKNEDILIDGLVLYTWNDINFAPVSLLKSATQKFIPLDASSKGEEAFIADLSYNGETKEVYGILNSHGNTFEVGGKEFFVAWSAKNFDLPFNMKLNKFNLERYPGSNSPSGYSSEISVIDANKSFDYNIFMNHVLDYSGFRFFQSSYDMDEKGTILSVNKDPGKIPTYIGYFLLCLGMFLNFFNPNSRFLKLSKKIDESSKQNGKIGKKGVLSILFIATLLSFPQNSNAQNLPKIDNSHTEILKSLVIQGFDGRMEPFDTLSRELLNKIYRSENFKDKNGNILNHNAAVLSFMINPDYWREQNIIKVSEKELKKILGIDEKATHAKIDDFFATKDGESYYKLGKMVEEINRKPQGNRTVLDKEILKVDERVNIFYMAYIGEFFRIIPKRDDQSNAWYSVLSLEEKFQGEEKDEISRILMGYFSSVLKAQKDGNWKTANELLEGIKNYQAKFGANVIPSNSIIKAELIFNETKIFKRLIPVYILAGFVLLVFVFTKMMKPKFNVNVAFKTVYIINLLAFLTHTIGLILRWYISGHAPWSNAYESLVYIAWALSLSGMIFSKRSAISLALTSILAGITLFVAHLSNIDPQITNIQPVLKSYWLTIHVSVITASYGFLGLCWLLGIFTLILFIIGDQKDEIKHNILEATRINEMAMILGLCLLTIGNFLGGVWANESWGRYWGWDSKETWALITILVYTAVVHFRFIPSLNSQLAFAIASTFAFTSVIMTYFGVNFYLTGMHSYASGERVPVPVSVWAIGIIMIILSFGAYVRARSREKL